MNNIMRCRIFSGHNNREIQEEINLWLRQGFYKKIERILQSESILPEIYEIPWMITITIFYEEAE